MFNKRVGAFITILRKNKKMTQAKLAEILGVSHQAVSNWERGESMPDISILPQLAGALDTTTDMILAANSEDFKGFDAILENITISRRTDVTPESVSAEPDKKDNDRYDVYIEGYLDNITNNLNNIHNKEREGIYTMNNNINNDGGIVTDENILKELKTTMDEYEAKIKTYEDRKTDLSNTIKDLENKKSHVNISQDTVEKIGEVINKVQGKIDEIDSDILALSDRIKEIDETLNPPPAPEEKTNEQSAEKSNEFDGRIADRKNKIKEKEKEIEKVKAEIKRIEEERDVHERIPADDIPGVSEIKKKIEEFRGAIEIIDSKINSDNINEATTDRLEDMKSEIEDKISDLEDRISEMEDEYNDKFDEYNDKIDEQNDRIDELNDEIDELNDEIEEITEEKDEVVDEDVINDVKSIPGLEDIFGAVSNAIGKASAKINESFHNINIPDIKIPKIEIPDIKIPKIDIPEMKINIPEIKIPMEKFNAATNKITLKINETISKGVPADEENISFNDIIAIAPFAKKETLDRLVDKLDNFNDAEKIVKLAPFLSKETLDKLVEKSVNANNTGVIVKLAPFLSRETLDKLVLHNTETIDFGLIKKLAPFLSQETLDNLVVKLGEGEKRNIEEIAPLAPFLSKESLKNLIQGSDGTIDMRLLKKFAPFLDQDYIDEIINKML